MQLANYWPILMFMGVGLTLCVVLILLGKILAPTDPYAEKLSTYECGFEPFGDARMQFDVRYYLVAILFILFDLETAFLIPWALSLQDTGWVGMLSMAIFILEFLVGYVYIWKRGALDWE